jgi:anti-sigma factor RsiW
MECRELTEYAIDRLTGQISQPRRGDLEAHLEACAGCRAELARIEDSWQALGVDKDAEMTEDFRLSTLALLEDEMTRGRIRAFRPRPGWQRLTAQAAGLLLAVGAGWLAHGYPGAAPPGRPVAREAGSPAANETVSNVSYRPADQAGRVAVSFDVTGRRTVVGRPEDPAVASLLAYLVSRGTQTSGEKSQAIELVSSHYGSGNKTVSLDIVRALTATLKKDENPGVRKKAASALAGFPMTPEIRSALLDALAKDRNPAVRLTAVDALAAAASQAPADERTIESLREKAFDPSENGFVRARAASALKAMEF